MKPRMKWWLLKERRCPKCSGKLLERPEDYKCENQFSGNPDEVCDFVINTWRYKEIIYSMKW